MDYDFSDITAGQTDADSIINQQLMDAIREDLYHIKEFCYGTTSPYTPAAKHNHNGTNSALVTNIADGAVSTPAKIANNVVRSNHIYRSNANIGYGTLTAGEVVSNFLSADTVFYTLHGDATGTRREYLRICGASGTDYRYLAIINTHATLSAACVVYYKTFAASKDRIIVYYDERTGEIVACWQSGQEDFPQDGEVIRFDTARPERRFIKRLMLKDDHPLVVKRAEEHLTAFQEGTSLAMKIIEDYVFDGRDSIEKKIKS